jgi:peptide/nickel transport system permease protein
MIKLRSLPGKTGWVILLLLLIIAAAAPLLAPYDPDRRFAPYQAPSGNHLLGTNDIGNDILSELIYGSRRTLTLGLLTGFCATCIGALVGLCAGYFKGVIDELLMGITDIVLIIPRIPLVIIVSAFLKPGYWTIVAVFSLLWWTTTARVLRSKTLQLREAGFVQSAQTMGFSSLHISTKEIVPNTVFLLIPKFMLTVASAMIAEASLSFLGLGDPGGQSWGMMVRFAFERGGFIRSMWWWYLPPGFAISLSVLSIALIGFSLEQR